MEIVKTRRGWYIIIIFAGVFIFQTNPVASSNNIHYIGYLVTEPCTLSPQDSDITLDFGTIVNRYIYENKRTLSQSFILHLQDCDVRVGNTVMVSFTGNENANIPGLLALHDSSAASGIAIGLETQTGEQLPINTLTQGQALTNGNNIITLQAYVQGEPAAIEKRSIGYGAFSAIATFVLDYQ